MTMKLFIIESEFTASMPIFAESYDQAAGHYVSWEIAKCIQAQGFTIERRTLGSLPKREAQHLREALRADVAGFGSYNASWGWTIEPPDP